MSRRLLRASTHSTTDVLLGPLRQDDDNWSGRQENLGHSSYVNLDYEKTADENKWNQRILLGLTLLAVVMGLVLGYILSVRTPRDNIMEWIGFPGDLYIRMLKCLIVPLVGLSLVGAMANLGAMKEGKVGLYAVLWYLFTTVIAGASGILWSLAFKPWNSLNPGESLDSSSSEAIPTPRTPEESVKQLFLQLFTDNITGAALDMNMLGIITFSCALGLVLASMEREKSEQVLFLFDSLNTAIQKMVGLVIWISPLGVLSLVAFHMGSSGNFWEIVKGMGLLLAARLTGVAVHGLVVLPLIYLVMTRKNPYSVLMHASQIWIVAFGTSSSAATLPITIKTVEENLEVASPIARVVCTTGATVNMDAGAIAYSVTAVSIANALGMHLNIVQMISLVFTSTLISVGAAALPSAGLVNYIAVMSTLGIPLERAIPILSPILSVDWFEDRIMTMVNIEGDVFAASTIHHHTRERT